MKIKGFLLLSILTSLLVVQAIGQLNPNNRALNSMASNGSIDGVSTLVYFDQSGRLAYNKFANNGETNKDNIIPDFSNAGYQGGGVALPNVSVKKTISAIAGDNRVNIQNAIKEVENLKPDKSGFRGALLLKAGLYNVEGSLIISKSGVVIRGEGQGINGTIIHATQKSKHNLIELNGAGTGYPEISASRSLIITEYLGTGTKTFTVASAKAYQIGDVIAVTRTPNQLWIDDLKMAQYGWTVKDYKVAFERKIVAIKGNSITIDAPIVDPIQIKYGGGYIYKTNITDRISNAGVENLRLTSYYENDTDEKHGWNAVRLARSENCWVKNVTAQYFGYSCVTVDKQSAFNTIQECAMLDPKSQTTGGRKYSFNIGGGSFNLFQRCYTRGGRHDFVTGAHIAGPNVFVDCYADDTQNDSGPHHRWATGTLFDNIYAGKMHVENRKAMGTGHGWAGAQTLFWNCTSVKDDIKVESPDFGATNWAIGCVGIKQTGTGFFESWGKAVQPRSIYLAQLKDRLGAQALANITISEQHTGDIYALLKAWAGEGELLKTNFK